MAYPVPQPRQRHMLEELLDNLRGTFHYQRPTHSSSTLSAVCYGSRLWSKIKIRRRVSLLICIFNETHSLTMPLRVLFVSWYHMTASVVRWPSAAVRISSLVQLIFSCSKLFSYQLFSYQPGSILKALGRRKSSLCAPYLISRSLNYSWERERENSPIKNHTYDFPYNFCLYISHRTRRAATT
jgi:hypothetical protein